MIIHRNSKNYCGFLSLNTKKLHSMINFIYDELQIE